MAEYKVTESSYVSGKDYKGIVGVVFTLLTEVKDEASDYGVKPKCKVSVKNGLVIEEKNWTLNQQNVNFMVEKFGGNSALWVGKPVGVFTEEIKGNTSLRIKEVAA
jgi:hypothetical protein